MTTAAQEAAYQQALRDFAKTPVAAFSHGGHIWIIEPTLYGGLPCMLAHCTKCGATDVSTAYDEQSPCTVRTRPVFGVTP